MKKPVVLFPGGVEAYITNREQPFTLKELQGIVGGMIEMPDCKDDDMVLVINEEGKNRGMEYNEAATKLLHPRYTQKEGVLDEWNTVVGTVLYCPRELLND